MRARQTGFTLIEVLVAFVVTTISVVVLMQVFTGGLKNLSRMEQVSTAAMIAESRMNVVGAIHPVVAGNLSGEDEDGEYRWEIIIEPWTDPQGYVVPTEGVLNLYYVEAVVFWEVGDRERTYILRSLRAGL